MRANPRDWRIEDVRAVCKAFALDLDRPPGGSHYGVSAPGWRQHVTVPFARPIRPVRRLVRFIDAVAAAREDR